MVTQEVRIFPPAIWTGKKENEEFPPFLKCFRLQVTGNFHTFYTDKNPIIVSNLTTVVFQCSIREENDIREENNIVSTTELWGTYES